MIRTSSSRHHLLTRRNSRQTSAGMTLLEVMVAVVIAATSITLIVPVFTNQLALSTEPTRLTAVESVVSRDLDWISDYARWWRLRSGPYTLLTASITLAPSGFTQLQEIAYEPPLDRCAAGTLANGFQADLAAVTTSPARPYPIDATSTAAATIATVNGINVIRSINPLGSRLQVLYVLSSGNSASLRFLRQASVLIEAAAWCDTLP